MNRNDTKCILNENMRYMMMRVYEMLTLTSYRLTVPAGKSDKLIITNKEAAPGLPTSNNNTPTELLQTLFMCFQGRRWIHISFLLLQLGKCSNNKEEWAVIHWPACQYKLFLFDNHFKIGQPTLHNSLVQRLQIKSSQHSLYPSFQFGWIKYLPESHALCRCRILRANLAQTIRVKREREGWTEKFWAAFTKMGKSTFR